MHVSKEVERSAAAVVVLLKLWAALAALTALRPAQCEPLSACDKLRLKYAAGGAEEAVSVYGRQHTLEVVAGGRAPARAAAALLAVGLRLRLRRRVALAADPAGLCALAAGLSPPPDALHANAARDPRLVLVPAARWGAREDACAALREGAGAGPRLRVQGAAAAPLALSLHARLSPAAAATPACRRAARWTFYRDRTALDTCGFLLEDQTTSEESLRDVRVYHPAERREAAARLATSAARFGVRLRPVELGRDAAPRRELLALVRRGTESFLFLDYDTWADLDGILALDPPPDEDDLASERAFRLADAWILRRVAPDVLRAFHRFQPTPGHLRRVLELEAERPDSNVTEAACEVAASAPEFESWFDAATFTTYEVAVFLCAGDPHRDEHEKVLSEVTPIVLERVRTSFEAKISAFSVDCTNEHSLMRKLMQRAQSAHWARCAGLLGAGEGARAAAAAARALDAALVLYDVSAPLPAATVRLATGSLDQLARALERFVASFGWSRLAVLSDGSSLAAALVGSLRAPGSASSRGALALRDVSIRPSPESALRNLVRSDARIIYVNSDSSTALSVLCAARDLDMTSEAGYVWILREWDVSDDALKCDREPLTWSHFTLSFWWRGGNASFQLDEGAGDTAVRAALDARWTRKGRAWPLRAAPLADALKLLLLGFQNFIHNNPHRRYDIHGGDANRLFWKNLDPTVEGSTQKFAWDEYGVKNPLVYVDRWRGNRREPLAAMRVSDEKIDETDARRIFPGSIPADGGAACSIASRADPFSPRCYDGACLTAALAGALALPALALARRVRRALLARRRRALSARLLARGARGAGALADLLVDRTALQLRDELGAGRFGRVRLAALRTPTGTLAVAAKALRDDAGPAEEREFLTEAVTLATLRHERVVRLVGVVADGGPPLVLMERAFFGDLLRYLRERRPLAGGAGGAAGEAAHVGARALTRLARQAAAALQYLAARRVVHRDVRAANCLVDARRSLKLGDFGLARRTDARGEYVSRRRGPLPVLWLAPESLARGAFSAASDAWALGVLLLELVTLGARPYGAWPPARVLRYVLAGGRPPLPTDVAPDTRRALAGCWRRAAHERSSAAALGALLDAEPELLRPALGPVPLDDALDPLDLTAATAPPER